MARIRQVKPELFDDPDVGQLPAAVRWVFAGLLTQADREGRLLDEPRRLKTRLCAYDDTDVDAALDVLARANLVIRYAAEGKRCLQIRTFKKHQKPHPAEAASVLPECPVLDIACPKLGNTQNIEQNCKAVKLHGEPCNSTASSADSGFLVLGSGSLVLGSGGRGTDSRHDAPSVPPRPSDVRHGYQSGAGAGTFPRDHLRCVQPCGRVCLPDTLFADFVKLRGGSVLEADAYVRAWHERVNALWGDDGPMAAAPIGDDRFAFWRARWRDEHGTTAKVATGDSLYTTTRSVEEQADAVRAILAAEERHR